MTNTQALIIALGIVAAGISLAAAQLPQSPSGVNGCIFVASPLTLTNNQRTAFTCDATGKLRVTTSF